MKMTFRWYGATDTIPLQYIRQIPNMSGVVTAVYDEPVGEVWGIEKIQKLKALCDAEALEMEVIESVPVHEDIKLGRGEVDKLLEVYCENIRRCAKYGVKCVTYNFMPVFDWTRTQLDKEAKDGSTSLVMYWEQMKGLDPLKDDIHLPGWDSSYTQEEVRELITAYGEIGEEGLWANLEKFLKKVIPVAEECGVRMAIHPDDPPYPIFGLPRIITNEENAKILGIEEYIEDYESLYSKDSVNKAVKKLYEYEEKLAFVEKNDQLSGQIENLQKQLSKLKEG